MTLDQIKAAKLRADAPLPEWKLWHNGAHAAMREGLLVSGFRADIHALADECLRLRAALGRLEWSCKCSGHTYCPSCQAAGDGEHYPGCELAEFAGVSR